MSIVAGEVACRRLRDDIVSLAIPDEPDFDVQKKFFPKRQLTELLVRDRIGRVLRCQCAHCTSRAEGRRHGDVSHLCDTILGKRSPETISILLFALLVFIECPQLISGFLEMSTYDKSLEEDVSVFTEEHVRRTYWPLFDSQHPKDSKRLANEFRSFIFKFTVPLISEAFVSYHRSTIFPFCNETPLGRTTDDGDIIQEGAFGRVFAFNIIDGYKDFQVWWIAYVRHLPD
jgi:hypothetical protein